MKILFLVALFSLTLCSAFAQHHTVTETTAAAQNQEREQEEELTDEQRKLFNDIHTFLVQEKLSPIVYPNAMEFKIENKIYDVTVDPTDHAPLFVTLQAPFSIQEDSLNATYLLQTIGYLNYNSGVKVIFDEDAIIVQAEFYLKNAEPFRYAFHRSLQNINHVADSFREVYQSFDTAYQQSNIQPLSEEKEEIVELYDPTISKNSKGICSIKNIEITRKQTIISFELNNHEAQNRYNWYAIHPYAKIFANGKFYKMTRVEGITLSPQKTYYPSANSTISFTLYFEPIPKRTQTLNFYEDGKSGWWFEGINLNQ